MKALSMFILLSLLWGRLMAQQASQSPFAISAGYGLLTVPQVIEGVSDILGTALTAGSVRFGDATFSGALLVSVKFPARKNLKFGLDGVYEQFSKKVYTQQTSQLLGTSEGTYLSLIPRIDYYWINQKALRLYSGLGLGVSLAEQKFDNDKVNRILFAFNVVPIGIELGGIISVYGESSFGYNGLLNAGLRLRL